MVWGQGEVAQTMYMHVSKCKSDKIQKQLKKKKRIKTGTKTSALMCSKCIISILVLDSTAHFVHQLFSIETHPQPLLC
jgi:hypothetical protein